jgi:hypothetical protein
MNMKKLMFVALIMSFIVAAGCGKSAQEKLLGTWKLKSVEGQSLSKEVLDNSIITFEKEGKLSAVSGPESKIEGAWEMSKDEKSLTISFKDMGDNKQVWNIQTLTEKEFVYTQGTEKEKITLGR